MKMISLRSLAVATDQLVLSFSLPFLRAHRRRSRCRAGVVAANIKEQARTKSEGIHAASRKKKKVNSKPIFLPLTVFSLGRGARGAFLRRAQSCARKRKSEKERGARGRKQTKGKIKTEKK